MQLNYVARSKLFKIADTHTDVCWLAIICEMVQYRAIVIITGCINSLRLDMQILLKLTRSFGLSKSIKVLCLSKTVVALCSQIWPMHDKQWINVINIIAIITLPPGRVRSIAISVSASLSVCLSISPIAYLKTTCPNFTKFCTCYGTRDCGSVLFWR